MRRLFSSSSSQVAIPITGFFLLTGFFVFVVFALVNSDRYCGDECKAREAVPTLVGGTLLGGIIGGMIASWFFLKVDSGLNDKIESADDNINQSKREINGRIDREAEKLKKDLEKKIGESIEKIKNLDVKVESYITKIDDGLQSKMNEETGKLKDKIDYSTTKLNDSIDISIKEIKGIDDRLQSKIDEETGKLKEKLVDLEY